MKTRTLLLAAFLAPALDVAGLRGYLQGRCVDSALIFRVKHMNTSYA